MAAEDLEQVFEEMREKAREDGRPALVATINQVQGLLNPHPNITRWDADEIACLLIWFGMQAPIKRQRTMQEIRQWLGCCS